MVKVYSVHALSAGDRSRTAGESAQLSDDGGRVNGPGSGQCFPPWRRNSRSRSCRIVRQVNIQNICLTATQFDKIHLTGRTGEKFSCCRTNCIRRQSLALLHGRKPWDSMCVSPTWIKWRKWTNPCRPSCSSIRTRTVPSVIIRNSSTKLIAPEWAIFFQNLFTKTKKFE